MAETVLPRAGRARPKAAQSITRPPCRARAEPLSTTLAADLGRAARGLAADRSRSSRPLRTRRQWPPRRHAPHDATRSRHARADPRTTPRRLQSIRAARAGERNDRGGGVQAVGTRLAQRAAISNATSRGVRLTDWALSRGGPTLLSRVALHGPGAQLRDRMTEQSTMTLQPAVGLLRRVRERVVRDACGRTQQV